MIPDYCEAITAWRVWNVHPSGLLAGHAVNAACPPYEALRAHCGSVFSTPAHLQGGQYQHPPVWDCECGIYALKTEALLRYRLENTWAFHRVRCVWGSVKIWGRVIEHDLGYRAEYAYPASLRCEDPELAAIVSRIYGVPCDVQECPPYRDPFEAFIKAIVATNEGFVRMADALRALDVAFQSDPLLPTGPPAAPVVVPPTLLSPWERRQRSRKAPAKDWRALMQAGFRAKAADPSSVQLP